MSLNFGERSAGPRSANTFGALRTFARATGFVLGWMDFNRPILDGLPLANLISSDGCEGSSVSSHFEVGIFTTFPSLKNLSGLSVCRMGGRIKCERKRRCQSPASVFFFFNHNLPPRTEGNMVESQVRFFFLKRSTRRVCLLWLSPTFICQPKTLGCTLSL